MSHKLSKKCLEPTNLWPQSIDRDWTPKTQNQLKSKPPHIWPIKLLITALQMQPRRKHILAMCQLTQNMFIMHAVPSRLLQMFLYVLCMYTPQSLNSCKIEPLKCNRTPPGETWTNKGHTFICSCRMVIALNLSLRDFHVWTWKCWVRIARDCLRAHVSPRNHHKDHEK